MPGPGISSYGIYIPAQRLERSAIAAAHAWAMPALKGMAKGCRSYCSWDEDSITMAVEAARGCLDADGTDLRAMTFASTTPVFSDAQNASYVAGALRLRDLSTLDVSGSLRAGTSSLIRAFEQAGSAGSDHLVVATDNRHARPASAQEMQYGAGSAAMLVSGEPGIARYLGSESRAEQFVDHFRAGGEDYDYYWEERWVRDEGLRKIIPRTVEPLLKKVSREPGSVAHLCLASAIRGGAAGVARTLGVSQDALIDDLGTECGDTGAAHPLMMLAAALERAEPGDLILVIGFGMGCDALLLEATDAVRDFSAKATLSSALAGGRPDSHYLRLLSNSGEIRLDWGMRAELDTKTALTELYRSADQISGFVGGRCADCESVQFPVLATCVSCGSMQAMTEVPLSDEPAAVATYTADWLQYTPSPPLYFGLVQFDNGARVLMEMVDVDADNFDVGTRLRMAFRIKEKDERRNHRRYFWKATPVGA